MTFHSTVGRKIVLGTLALMLASIWLSGCSGKKSTPEPTPVATAPDSASATTPVTKPDTPEPIKPAPAVPKLPGAIAVMIDNQADARPQSGVDKADIVYEMEAEGGITRFLALFYMQNADKIGPVRSARMGFYDIVTAYGLPYAHAGGNYDVLLELQNRNKRLLNLDEIKGSGGAFWRSTDRLAPHNLYTSTDKIVNQTKASKFPFKPLAFFPQGAAPAGGKSVATVAFSWGPKSQQVTWAWNGKRYERSQAGVPHVLDNGVRLQTDNLVILFTKFVWNQQLQDGEGQNNVTIVGSGSGYFYRDGNAYPIRWSKGAKEEAYALSTSSGEPLQFAAGQTWVEVLKAPEHVTEGAPQ